MTLFVGSQPARRQSWETVPPSPPINSLLTWVPRGQVYNFIEHCMWEQL